jgi:hypothetical protein
MQAEPMTDREVRLMTSMYASSWPGSKLDDRAQRDLAAVLRGCTWDEAYAALLELRVQYADHPAGSDITARIEAVRRRGVLPVASNTPTAAQRARGLLRARRALVLAQPEAKSA